jgi:hypothetical protein
MMTMHLLNIPHKFFLKKKNSNTTFTPNSWIKIISSLPRKNSLFLQVRETIIRICVFKYISFFSKIEKAFVCGLEKLYTNIGIHKDERGRMIHILRGGGGRWKIIRKHIHFKQGKGFRWFITKPQSVYNIGKC